jgi:hypothetical protein
VTATVPPSSWELADRIIGDTAVHVRVPREELAARVAIEIRNSDVTDSMIEGQEIARDAVDAHWTADELEDVVTRALETVRLEYMEHASVVSAVIDDLARSGRSSWIAQALRHRIAFDVTWEALDRLGELTHFPDEALCATCGAALGTGAEERS